MNTIYFDCSMGAAGDMLTAALLELLPEPEKAVQELNSLGIPGVRFCIEKTQKCGITGTHVHVFVWDVEEHEHIHAHQEEHHRHHIHDHHHSGMEDIAHILSHLKISEKVRADALAVYGLIAQAESHVHGVPVEQIHFHEVGNMDAIADVTAVCYLLEKLRAEKILASAVHVGSGQVKCAHGILPVPAPATAYILRDVPIYSGEIRGELCTPTGAALLKYFVSEFGKMPAMSVSAIGYGMGKKDFPAANCVRAMLGKTADTGDTVISLACNLDDMTGEEIGFATEQLLSAGALDVYTTAIGMKKNRPGVMLTVLCKPKDREAMVQLLFRHTTTLGIRESEMHRYTLTRRTETVQTPYGPARQKVSTGYGAERRKWEYEDLARIAKAQDADLLTLKESL